MTDPVALRSAEPGDRPAILDLWQDAWTAAMPAIDFEARRRWFSTHLDALERAGASLIVAEVGGAVAGFITLDRATGEIDQLAVAPCAQGRGIAAALMDQAKGALPTGLRLSVNQANAHAIGFYERQGFRRVGSGVNARSGLPLWRMAWP